MPKRSTTDRGLFILVVALLSWTVPGAGFAVMKEYKRAVIVFIAITMLFAMGLYIGSIGVIDTVNAKPWYFAQIITSPAVELIAQKTRSGAYPVYGKPMTIGQIYTMVAGLLNLLCIVSASYMAYYGRTELIGEEDAQ